MVVERFDTFIEWLLPNTEHVGALVYFALMAAGGILVGILLGYLVAAFRHGLGEGFYSVATTIAGAVPDFLKISMRRVLAVARLAVKESIRARVIVAFIVFMIVLMYARWFLDVKSDDPAKLYMLFIINATKLLMVVLAILISTFSLPKDIKERTIYTVVTKPVRASEIVLGRMLGFSIVGTVILVAMGVVGYVFLIRGLDHTHRLEAEPGEIAEALADSGSWTGRTTLNAGHRHDVTIQESGDAVLSGVTKDHRHEVYREDGEWKVSGPVDQLQARVPHYGKLRFLNRSGGPGTGISVGKEWTYRKYIEGESLAAAIWLFDDIRAERFGDVLPLEMTLSVFRTYKADIRTGVKGSITLKNPDPGAAIRQSVPITFYAREFETDQHYINRKVQAVKANGQTVPEADIFEDLCDENGRIEVWIRCEDRSQYFGVSQGDLYVLESERPFAVNYVKGFLGIWMQMVLVICFGVAVSTRLNGPIAMLATLSYIIIGSYRDMIVGVFKSQWENNPLLTDLFGTIQSDTEVVMGGGPIESMIRLLTQKNLISELDMGWIAEGVVRWTDLILQSGLVAVTHFAPDFSKFNTANYLAEGYDISGHIVASQATTCFSYILVTAIVGYFFLKTREIAA